MTRKDKEIQDLRRENQGLREEVKLIVESLRICRYCKYLDADCVPRSKGCHPEWRGLK